MLLREKDKLELLKIFSKATFPIEVWAYGSRVNGDAHQGSDLDLVVRSQNLQKLPIGFIDGIKEIIRESNIPILVDVFDWSSLPSSFHLNIEGRHEVLFSNISIVVNDSQASIKK